MKCKCNSNRYFYENKCLKLEEKKFLGLVCERKWSHQHEQIKGDGCFKYYIILCWNFSEKTNSKLLFSRLQKPFLYVA